MSKTEYHHDLDSYLANEVYPLLFNRLDIAFPDFQWEKRGDHWVARRWPSDFPLEVEHRRPDRLVVYRDRPYWITAHGHGGVRLLDLINGGRRPSGAEFSAALLRICELAGVPAPQRRFNSHQEELARTKEVRRSILDIAVGHIQDALWSPAGASAREYLLSKRGLTDEDIKNLGIGLYLHAEDVIKLLESEGFAPQEIKDSGVCWSKLQGYLYIPWHDDLGRPLTLYGRWPAELPPLKRDLSQWRQDRDREREAWEKSPRDKEWKEPTIPKTIALPGNGTKASPLFLDRALCTGHRDVVLVEGVFDGATLQVRGDTRAVASAAAQLSQQQVETLIRRQIRSVYICGDPDSGGDKGTLANITSLEKAGIRSYVVPRLPEGMDPDEYVLLNGIEEWKKRVANSIHSYHYIAHKIVEKHKAGESWTDQAMATALEEAIRFDASVISADRLTDLDRFFWPVIYESTGVDVDAIIARRQSLRDKKARDREIQSYRSFNDAAAKLLRAGNLEETKDLYKENLQRLQEEERAMRSEPVLCLSEELLQHNERLKRYLGADFIGLPQRTIPKVDSATLGMRGLMLLASAPNVGKTALTVQFGVDVVAHNPDTCFLFVSLEMPRWDIYSRIKSRLARMDWETLVFGSGRRCQKHDVLYSQEELANLQKAEALMADLGKRIRVLDERNFPNPTISSLLFHLRELKASTGSKRALVLVDYLQVWPVPESAAQKIHSDLDSDKYRIGIMKTLRDAAEDDAILVISEARKPSGKSGEKWGGAVADIMGSARGSYTPDMIFLFRPFDDNELLICSGQDVIKMNKEEKKEIADELRAELTKEGKAFNKLEIAKGRDGVRRGTIVDLTFWFRQSSFTQGVE